MKKQATEVVNGREGQFLLINATFTPFPLLYFSIYRNKRQNHWKWTKLD